MRSALSILLAFLTLTPWVRADPPVVETRVSASTITVAERVTLTVTITSDPDLIAELPVLSDSLGEFLVVSHSAGTPSISTAEGKSRRMIAGSWVLEPFLPGQYEIPALDITAHSSAPGAPATTLHTEPVTVAVKSVLPIGPAPTDVGPARSILPPPELARPVPWLEIGAGVAGAVALTGIAFLTLRRRAAAPDPAALALRRLHAIPADASPAAVADAVATNVRGALASRVDVRAAALTTPEIAALAPQWAIAPDAVRLVELLDGCDAVRYAGAPLPSSLASDARDLVSRVSALPPLAGHRTPVPPDFDASLPGLSSNSFRPSPVRRDA